MEVVADGVRHRLSLWGKANVDRRRTLHTEDTRDGGLPHSGSSCRSNPSSTGHLEF